MCGIAGFIDYKKQTSPDVLTRMSDTLSHRGPDGSGHSTDEGESFTIGLGHRRLSIIELSETGKQPMYFGSLSITFNGEIYNYKEIAEELRDLGHTFRSHSDTEVILHAFSEWGIACLHKFIGMFAFVLYDAQDQKVHFVRDRAGIKPFYYFVGEDLLLFASELKALLEHPSYTKTIKLSSVAAFMQYGNVPCPNTIFNDTFKLKPGHYMEIDLKTREYKEVCYWDVNHFYNLPKLQITEQEAKDKTVELLRSAFKYRMVSDVPVGIFLSGGYDSSCVAAILKEEYPDLSTFTIGFEDARRDEAPEAKKIADFLKTNHTELYCTEKELLDVIGEIPHFYDEPFGDSSAIPTMSVSKLAKKYVTVALSADGGDELFAGYYKYGDFYRIKSKLDKIPGFLKRALGKLLELIPPQKIPYFNKKYNFRNRYEKFKDLLADSSDESILNVLNQQFTDKQVVRLFEREFRLQPLIWNRAPITSGPLSFLLSTDYQTYMIDDILQKVDRASMSASLEGREPFLDHRVVEFVARLPDEYKYKNGDKKYLLKSIVHDFIPKHLMDRPKKGFATPLVDWLQNELKEKVDEFINEKEIVGQNIFNWNEINRIKQDFYAGKVENDMKLWYILMFQMWYKKWMG